MNGLHRVRSHEDEPAWGHLLRAELAGGSRSPGDLGRKRSSRSALLAFLASCDGVSVSAYAALHGESVLIGSMGRWNWDQRETIGLPLLVGGRGAQRDTLPRACQRCVHESATKFGYAWFQRSHNLAGVASCHKHGETLFIAGTAAERSKFSASLGQLESRSRSPMEFAYVDDFVRRYELALLTIVQRKNRRDWSHVFGELLRDRVRQAGLERKPRTIVDLVMSQANADWLQRTFICHGGHGFELRDTLAEAHNRPTYAYHQSLLLAAAFDDPTELSLTLRAHGCGKPIDSLLK